MGRGLPRLRLPVGSAGGAPRGPGGGSVAAEGVPPVLPPPPAATSERLLAGCKQPCSPYSRSLQGIVSHFVFTSENTATDGKQGIFFQ